MTDKQNAMATAKFQNAFTAFQAGQIEAAENGFRDVLDAEPRNADALYFLAVIAYQSGRNQDALEIVDTAIAYRRDSPDLHNLRGLALIALERGAEACEALQKSAACDPNFADPVNNLGVAQESLGQQEEAEASYRRAIALNGDYAQAFSNLGRILLSIGQPAEAEEACRRALDIQPDLADARFNLAVAQQRQGLIAEAEATVRASLISDPDSADLHRYLGALLHRQGDLNGAETALRNALSRQPTLGEAHDNLATVLLDQGHIDDAETHFKKALDLNPTDSRAQSNLLLCRNYHVSDPAVLLQEHREWVEQHAIAIASLVPPIVRETRIRLRIGYLSADFRRHSVASFFEPLLVRHDQSRFEIFCYANLENPDATTARLQTACDHWRWVAGLTDDQLAKRIQADGIDILVDLSGHTAGNRLLALQRKPAPIQATWLGYPNTTGLTAIDYRLTDAVADPPGAERFATETLLRLEDGFLCYQPPGDAPDVAPLPAQSAGHVTFGSFNNLRKVTPAVIAVWAEILHRAPPARLHLKARPFADHATVAHFTDVFRQHGIAAERITLRGPLSTPSDHLGAYAEMDIALDCFPYNGTTTTCEALWMGVPVVTLAGDRHAARVGASLLTRVGLEDCIAAQLDDYIGIAARLANDIEALAGLRAGMRDRLSQSSLCDGDGFRQRIEAAYEQMWRNRHSD
ncbi:MAG: tetratricopeptide repeat protein [Alphaproteobacteria bacterium]|nr:tetratricopeptide repeat protein [Alphaproteobacteria bacterium]